MSHSNLAVTENREALVAHTWHSLSREHIQDLFTYKEAGKEMWALDTRGGKGAAGKDGMEEASE